jgi:hypothetical protein
MGISVFSVLNGRGLASCRSYMRCQLRKESSHSTAGNSGCDPDGALKPEGTMSFAHLLWRKRSTHDTHIGSQTFNESKIIPV